MQKVIRQTILWPLLAALLVAMAAVSNGQSPCPRCGRIHSSVAVSPSASGGVENVVNLLNRQRAMRGKPPMTMDPAMQRVAEQRVRIQASRRARGYHVRPLNHGFHEGIGWSSGGNPTAVRACYTYSNFRYVGAAMIRVPGGGSYFACVYR